VLRLLRRRCLARLRKEAEPVPQEVLARFLPAWHGISGLSTGKPGAGRGGNATRRPADAGAVLEVVERLAGAPVPASALETLVLPGRVPGYSPALLDELTSAGEVVWSGAGALPGGDGWLVLAPADGAGLVLPEPGEVSMTPVHTAVLEALGGGGALFFRMLSDRVAALLGGSGVLATDDGEVATAVWDLVWAGLLTNDTLAPLRILLGGQQRRAAAPAGRVARPRPGGGRRYGFGRPPMPTRTGPPTVNGRWSLLPGRQVGEEPDRWSAGDGRDASQTVRTHALAVTLLERHGVLTRGAVAAEHIPGGFAAVYPVLRAMEEAGQCRRGYFVEGLGAAQFALPGAVDRMRAMARGGPRGVRGDGSSRAGGSGGEEGFVLPGVTVLAAADPAQPYGAALAWPDRPGDTPSSHRPGRKAGALVVLVEGSLVLYVERGGRTLLSWTDDPVLLGPGAAALAAAVRGGALGRLTVERADGLTVGRVPGTPLAQALEAAGFRPTPRGLRLRAG
jgi:ATP-dependent helicase Lhr and Lhr-like helicase